MPTDDDAPQQQSYIDLDARSLRALAHPVRVQLLGELRKNGASTATRLGERLAISSGTASYHLRQLGAAGFVAEDTERGNARERWWRARHQMTRMQVRELTEQEPEAAMIFRQSIESFHTQLLRESIRDYTRLPTPWQEVFGLSDRAFRLTVDEAHQLRREIEAVVNRYRADVPEERSQAPAGAERVVLISHLLPEVDLDDGQDER